MSDPHNSFELERIIESAEAELRRQIRRGLFSADGFQRVSDRVNEFIQDLAIESMRIAKRHQSDYVSAAYVNQASEHLTVRTTQRWQRVVGGIGGIVLGVGLASAGSMIQSGQFSTRGFILSIVCIVLGMPSFMFHIMKE